MGPQGVAAPANVPGARFLAVCWTDAFGNFWLFGGVGLDSAGTRGSLNDLWKYSPAPGMWTWMTGPSTLCNTEGDTVCPGVYGTQGVSAATSTPGGRTYAAGWVDSSGSLWLFGGSGWDGAGTGGNLNDLWRYSGGEWTWMSGSNRADRFGVYGTMGVPVPGNVPGARVSPVTWVDKSGNLWLFGGEGNDLNGVRCEQGGGLACDLNDLWRYTPATNMWTWLGGSNVIAQTGVYGTPGVAAPANFPGARWLAVGWTDAAGDFWLFGGTGFDSLGSGGGNADLNDLWKYSAGQWMWINGSDIANQAGTYGTLGMAAPDNVPGAREAPAAWIDPAGNPWLFGGQLLWAAPNGKFNDLWKYQP